MQIKTENDLTLQANELRQTSVERGNADKAVE